MLKIGLTGGIGTGKTSIAKIFESLGVPVYYSDLRAIQLTNNNFEIKSNLIKEFGSDIYLSEDKLNKDKLRKLIFNNKENLQKVNSIIHPVVKQDFENWLQKNKNAKYIIKEAAILIESGAYKQVDKIILVRCDLKTRIKHLKIRDKETEAEIKRKISAQMPESEKIKFADYIINNNPDDLLIPQVMRLHKILDVQY